MFKPTSKWFLSLPYHALTCIIIIALVVIARLIGLNARHWELTLTECLTDIIVIGLVVIARLIGLNAKHRELALTDRLTQAGSRLEGDMILEKLERRRSFRLRHMRRLWSWWKVQVAIIEVDLDHFKKVNDTYGHGAGDVVLTEVARRLQACLRRKDKLIRPGGEELYIILPGLSKEDAMVVAERLRQAVDTTIVYNEQQIKVSASFGVALFTEETPMKGVRQKGDRALYRAKEGGRNRVEPQSARAPEREERSPEAEAPQKSE